MPGELPLGPHQAFHLLHLFYSNVRTSGVFYCKRQPFACDRYSHLCVESSRSQDELDLSVMSVLCRVVGGFEALTAMENVESHTKTDKPKVREGGLKGGFNSCAESTRKLIFCLQIYFLNVKLNFSHWETDTQRPRGGGDWMTTRRTSFIQLFNVKIWSFGPVTCFFLSVYSQKSRF